MDQQSIFFCTFIAPDIAHVTLEPLLIFFEGFAISITHLAASTFCIMVDGIFLLSLLGSGDHIFVYFSFALSCMLYVDEMLVAGQEVGWRLCMGLPGLPLRSQ